MMSKRKISLIIALTVAALLVAETAYAGYTTPEIYGQNIRGSFGINNGATHTASRDVTLNSSIIPSWRYYQYYFQSWYYNFAVNTSGFVPPYEWSGYEYVGGDYPCDYPCGTTVNCIWKADISPYPKVNANGFRTDHAGVIYLNAGEHVFEVWHDDGVVLKIQPGIVSGSGGATKILDEWKKTAPAQHFSRPYQVQENGLYTLFVHHFNYVSTTP